MLGSRGERGVSGSSCDKQGQQMEAFGARPVVALWGRHIMEPPWSRNG
jgi:hypothetical protein